MKDQLEYQIINFVKGYYQNEPGIVETTAQLLETADYLGLVAFMEQVGKNSRYKPGVLHFELLGYVYQLNGETLATHDIEAAIVNYEKALAAYEKGMHFATGSGEGWHFRDLYDAAKKRSQRLVRRHRR